MRPPPLTPEDVWAEEVRMKLRVAVLLLSAMMAVSACGTPNGRTVELPGGVTPEQQAAARGETNPTIFDRMIGRDMRPNVGPCPLMGVLYDTSRQVSFAAPNNERYANIDHTGEMEGVRGLCRYLEADPIVMSLDIDMSFGRGPASTSDRQTYRYWVAVTRRGIAPIAKEYYNIDVRWDRGQAVVSRTEHIDRIVIPRAQADTSGENFEILVGFDLTPEQLAFNRAGRRFRIDAGQPQSASAAPAAAAH